MKPTDEAPDGRRTSRSRRTWRLFAPFGPNTGNLSVWPQTFQDFGTELQGLPGKYRSPAGALALAFIDQKPAGTVALRPLNGPACEVKRLYRPTRVPRPRGWASSDALDHPARQRPRLFNNARRYSTGHGRRASDVPRHGLQRDGPSVFRHANPGSHLHRVTLCKASNRVSWSAWA